MNINKKGKKFKKWWNLVEQLGLMSRVKKKISVIFNIIVFKRRTFYATLGEYQVNNILIMSYLKIK